MPQWEVVGGLAPVWIPKKKGDTIEGTITRVSAFENRHIIEIDTSTGKKALFTSAVLENLISDFKVGVMIKLEYKGKRKFDSGRTGHDWKVYKATQ